MEKEPRPLVMEVRSGAYLSTSASGTCTLISCPLGLGSTPSTRPRRLLRSPITSPMYSSGTDHLHVHDGFQKNGIGLQNALLEGHGGGDLEGDFRGVHLVGLPVVELHLQVHHRVSGQNPALHGFVNPFFHCGDEVPGHVHAHQGVLEFETPCPGAGGRARNGPRQTGPGRRSASCVGR